LEAERHAAEVKRTEADSKRAIAFLKELKNTGADVTKYLEAQAVRPDGGPPGLREGAQAAKAAGGGWW